MMIPCSRGAHVYRRIVWAHELFKQNISNEYRVAAVWMDDYKKNVFEMTGNYSVGFYALFYAIALQTFVLYKLINNSQKLCLK